MASGKVIIVTGASRGIGKAIVEWLSKPLQNCKVVAVARSRQALLDLQQLSDSRIAILDGDLEDVLVAQQAVALALEKWSRLDGLILNHGTLEPLQRLQDADVDQWKKSFNVNVFSAVALIKVALPSLRQANGKIIFTSSGASVKGTSTWGTYSAGKAVYNSLARTLAEEEPHIVSVAVRPGVVDTQMQDIISQNHSRMEKKDAERFATLRREGKMLRPEQPGNVMARLVLDADQALSGEFVNWDDERLGKFQDL